MSQAPQLNQGIKVFYSYSHKDEQLRDELAKHLSILRRQGVISEWHDRKIGAGSEWAGEIDQHLNTAQIILLLISPDFLASDYCYDIEMKRAMERHDASEARVIPVILRPVLWMGMPFSKLQALPKDGKAVTLWQTLDEAFVSVAEGIRESVEDLKRRSILQVSHVQQVVEKITFQTLVVDQLHRGDYVTITDAIKAAKPGDRILVRAGLYQEGFIIDKPLEIIGDGEPGEVVIQTGGQHVVLFEAIMGRVANLTLRQIGGGSSWFAVAITQGRLEVEGCDISSQGLACVAIHDGANPRLRHNRIYNSNHMGIYVFDNGQGILEDNEIFRNTYSGIVIESGGNPTIRRNRIYNNKQSGVVIIENGLGTLEENDIFGNVGAGIAIGVDSTSIVRYNRINKNGYEGVWISQRCAGTFEDNDLRNNVHGAWYISKDSLPNIKRERNIEK
ncbi:MAG: right-handed parallel beta-helix repeat-containing protein [Chloroflexi bacterium]|nr:right-handed parallel beta-helix repeat-containing protein [Chloroflexota bacterium]